MEKQDSKEPDAAQSSGNACLGEALKVVIMGVIHDLPVVERFVSREDNLERAKTGANPRVSLENPPSV
jgi:hypothetical protein